MVGTIPRCTRLAAAVIVVVSFARPAAAAEPELRLPDMAASAVEYHPLERRLFEAAGNDTLRSDQLLWAALVAGGATEDDSLRRYEQAMRHWSAQLRREIDWSRSQRERAGEVLRFLHREILMGEYHLNVSRVDEAIDTGRFNCVSASVLFNCLASAAGLTACGGQRPSHVVSLVATHDGALEIETTSPRGLIDGGHVAARRHDGSPPRERPGPARRLSTAQLAAMVYYNRGVDYVEREQFAAAVAANYKAYRLDRENTSARGNLLAAINNWAIHLAGQGRIRAAVHMLGQAREMAPEHRSFTTNYRALSAHLAGSSAK